MGGSTPSQELWQLGQPWGELAGVETIKGTGEFIPTEVGALWCSGLADHYAT